MRKLGILLAVMVAATLGYSGTASASGHEESLCPVFDDPLAAGAEAHPFADQDPSDPAGEPLTSTFKGAAESCRTSDPNPLLCGVATGLENRLHADPPAVDALDAVTDGIQEATCPAATGDDDDDDDDGDDDDVKSAVKQNNAAGDGSLPRTGGELFAGAGFGLMSLGALVRRFLP